MDAIERRATRNHLYALVGVAALLFCIGLTV